MIPEKSHADPKAYMDPHPHPLPCPDSGPLHPATLTPKDAEGIYQNGARGHRCFEASTITIAGELLLLQSAVSYWVQIFFSCSNLLYTVLLLLFVKNKTKKIKIKQTPNFSKGSFLPLQ